MPLVYTSQVVNNDQGRAGADPAKRKERTMTSLNNSEALNILSAAAGPAEYVRPIFVEWQEWIELLRGEGVKITSVGQENIYFDLDTGNGSIVACYYKSEGGSDAELNLARLAI
jgi:hypothetical protein